MGPPATMASANMKVHPCEAQASKKFLENQERLNLQKMSVQYGSHMPMRMVIERNILASTQRLGGYGSSMHGLKQHMGIYERLDFEDVLNLPDESPLMDRETHHARLEKVYGL